MSFVIGDRVQVRADRGPVSADVVSGWGTVQVDRGDILEVTRVATNKFIGRKNGRESAWFYNADFEMDYGTSSTPEGKPRRRPGDVPEGQLSPHDPRLEWFWDDVSDVIARSNYCSQVDSVLASVQAPPRKRNFTAHAEINGLAVGASVLARTQEEADMVLLRKLTTPIIDTAEAVAASEGEAE